MAAIKEIGISDSASTEVANQLLDRIQEYAQKIDELAKLRKRIASMQEDSETFKQRAKELADLAAPDLADMPAEGIASQLSGQLAQAQKDDALRKLLGEQCHEQERELVETQEAIDRAGLEAQADVSFGRM